MLSAAARPSIYRQVPRATQPGRCHYSTTKANASITSKSFAAAVVGLGIGLSSGYYLQKDSTKIKRVFHTDFHPGSLEWKSKVVKPFTLDDVKEWLGKEVSSRKGPIGSGVQSWYTIRTASNSPCEDNLVASQQVISAGQEKPWLFWGVFDGHLGSAMSSTLRETLVPYVARGLSKLHQISSSPSSAAVNEAIMSSFKLLDDEIIADCMDALKSSKTATETFSRLALGYAGSCAILSIYDPNTKFLRVAVTGDCRAVLGSRSPSGKYSATALSIDQTGFNELELARVRAEHPNEPDVIDVKTGRTLRLAPSRAFGDGLWKWPKEFVQECKDKYLWKAPLDGYLTPPYLTAEPVVTTTQIKGEGEFMIMASDGFWDHVSNEQAVRLVEMWLLAKKNGTIGKGVPKVSPTPVLGNVKLLKDEFKVEDKNFVVEDENVASHLVRNSLGGGDTDTLCGLVGLQAPLSREARDDITVQVVFFDDSA